MASEPMPLFQSASFGPFFDAIPAMLLVLDFDARIHAMNAAALEGLGLELEQVHHHKTGDILHCLHAAYAQDGCGRSDFCRSCVIRNAVVQAMAGERTSRRGVHMVLKAGDQLRDIHVLVSVSPVTWQGHPYAILMLENVSDLFQLRHLLPICMHCHKIRDEHGSWHQVEAYFSKQLDIDFSHGICPDCLATEYPDAKHLRNPSGPTPAEHP
ncbi:MAG TPA: PAS domain-containing protein [Holophaga sp.]|nr:PAS domain-containing protein [Holophaga sp.]